MVQCGAGLQYEPDMRHSADPGLVRTSPINFFQEVNSRPLVSLSLPFLHILTLIACGQYLAVEFSVIPHLHHKLLTFDPEIGCIATFLSFDLIMRHVIWRLCYFVCV